ncbi:hypothetical protein [Bacillus sp. SJS]|uniref:hypothetical protein n=1 Tax=Bacillus sp. SJS TaxID=1423321 RepID=UPI0004DD77CF|nr:hypothetical protein [Bacillus sp. SJS]KZZ86237.1 hypothetical protein AS29_001285 [Bacillus sp. SJS]
MDLIMQNKEWLFSGLGISVITVVIWTFKNFKGKDANQGPSINQTQNSGNNSTNIQGGQDVNVEIGDSNDRR